MSLGPELTPFRPHPDEDAAEAGTGRRARASRATIPDCDQPGAFRAPMGRDREGQYFCFCLDHVREYNARYNYFNGMSDEAVSRWMKDALVGHRPTWAMGRGARGPGVARSARPARGSAQRTAAGRAEDAALRVWRRRRRWPRSTSTRRRTPRRSGCATRNWSSACIRTRTAAIVRAKANCARSSRPINICDQPNWHDRRGPAGPARRSRSPLGLENGCKPPRIRPRPCCPT